ncbi:MAG TPA: hypothetical protein VL523_17150 [Terriglobia bacterium]|nr:hypothetical protein [Terriglobia bacterium]
MKRGLSCLLSAIVLAGTLAVANVAFARGQQAAPDSSKTASAPAAPTGPSAPAQNLGQVFPQAPFDPANQPLVLPAGSILHIRLTTTLTSKTNKTGDKFTGMVTQAVVAGDKTLVPEGSLIDGHVTMTKASGRVAGRASMRIVLDHIDTPDNVNYNLSASLQDLASSTCTKGVKDDEGTIAGCGKSKKSAAEGAAIAGGIGAATGASIGGTEEMICQYYGCPNGGPNIGADVGYGAAIGAGTALLYSLFRHEKQIVLIEGTDLTFVVNHTVEQSPPSVAETADKS